jgi:hypothetical protein
MAPVFTVTFFSAMGAMEGQSPAEIITKVKEATWPALVSYLNHDVKVSLIDSLSGCGC